MNVEIRVAVKQTMMCKAIASVASFKDTLSLKLCIKIDKASKTINIQFTKNINSNLPKDT